MKNYNDDRDEWYKIDVKELVGATHAPVLSNVFGGTCAEPTWSELTPWEGLLQQGEGRGTSSQWIWGPSSLAGDGGVALTRKNQVGVFPQ
jgi:hypothetical protein